MDDLMRGETYHSSEIELGWFECRGAGRAGVRS